MECIFRSREKGPDVTLQQVEVQIPVKDEGSRVLSMYIEVRASVLVNMSSKIPVLFAVNSTVSTNRRASLGISDTAIGPVASLDVLLECQERAKRFGAVKAHLRSGVEWHLINAACSKIFKMQCNLKSNWTGVTLSKCYVTQRTW